MATIGISTIRNEGDILPETLAAWAEALDLLLVADCGSTDCSVEVIREAAARHSNIVFLGSVGPLHARQVRRHIWERFRRHLSRNDWWMTADGDEFVEEGYRAKLALAEREMADHVFSAHVNFYYAEADHALWEAGLETLEDRRRPIAERRRHYQMHTTQRRVFRNLPWLLWNEDESFPRFLSNPATERILFRHYQYRDPVQMQDRIDIRRSHDPESDVMRENPHWARSSYRQAVSRDPRLLRWDEGRDFVPSGEVAEPRDTQPLLKTWAKYARAIAMRSMLRQQPTTWFPELDVKAALRCMRTPEPRLREAFACIR